MYGMGWRIFQYNGNHTMIFHAGGLSGVRSRLGFLPEKDIGIVMLWNANESRPEVLMPMLFDRLLDLPAVDYLDGAAGHSNYYAAQKVPPSLSATKHSLSKWAVKSQKVTAVQAKKKATVAQSKSKKAAVAQSKRKSTYTKAQPQRASPKPAQHKVTATKAGVIKPLARPHTRTAPVKAGEIRSLTAERVGYDPAQGPSGKK